MGKRIKKKNEISNRNYSDGFEIEMIHLFSIHLLMPFTVTPKKSTTYSSHFNKSV